MAQNKCFLQVASILLLILAVVASVRSHLDYPGRAAYKQLDEYLQKKGTEVKNLEQNLQAIGNLLKDLEKDTALVAPRHLMQAANLVISLKRVTETGVCNATTVQLIAHNTMGAYSDDSTKRFDHPNHLDTSRLVNTITRLVHQVLLKCELTIEPRLTLAIEPINTETINKLESYFSEQFIKTYVEIPQVDPQLGKLAPDLLSTEKNFNNLPYPLMLEQLFNVSLRNNKLQDNKSFSVNYHNNTYNWCKIRKNVLQDSVATYIMDPCRTFVDQTRSVFGLYHFVKTYYNDPSSDSSYPRFDFDLFLTKVSNEFKYRLFRYEFCFKFALEAPFWTLVWRNYVEITHEATLSMDSNQGGQ